MTAIIYEIKHNSALCQVGQLSRSLNKSPLFTAHNDLKVKHELLQGSITFLHVVANQFTDLSLALNIIISLFTASRPNGACVNYATSRPSPLRLSLQMIAG